MQVELTLGDIETLLISLEYSKLRIRDASNTPYSVRKENLDRLDSVAAKLRKAKSKGGSQS